MNFEELLNSVSIEDLKGIVNACYYRNGELEEYHWEVFDDDFFDSNFAHNPMEAARATHFGKVNWMDDFIRFNGCGNLESCSEWHLEAELNEDKRYILETALDLFETDSTDFNTDIQELFNEYLDRH